ncbi:MAG: hypothetical protein Kow0025_09850 [Thermodesulfovibrionales bacterium]
MVNPPMFERIISSDIMYKKFGKYVNRKRNKETDRLINERADKVINKLRGRIGKKKTELESLKKLSVDPLHAKDRDWIKAKLSSLNEEIREIEAYLKKYSG